jgi:hypothetical protein
MKTFHLISTFAAIALALPAAERDRQSSNVSDSGSSSATARQAGATSGSNTSTSAGMAFHNGQPYIIRNSQATRFDEAVVPANKMLTDDGRLVEVPDGIAGMTRKSSNVADGGSASATARQSGAISGSQTGGNTQDGWIMKDGAVYRVENGRATRIEESAIPKGQMMGAGGRTMATPEGLKYDSAGSSGATRNANDETHRASSGTSSSATARDPSGSTNSSRSDTKPQR